MTTNNVNTVLPFGDASRADVYLPSSARENAASVVLRADDLRSGTTMSSLEIAALVEKRHDNVKRTIEALIERELVHPQIEDVSERDALGRLRNTRAYRVGKRDSHVIVAQLSPEFTARLVDRWQELEAAASPVLPSFADPVAAARAWADAKESEQRAIAITQQQAAQLEAQKPAVDFVAKYVAGDGPKGVRQVVQMLNVNERKFIQFLLNKKIMYRLQGRLVPMANQRHTGRFVIKAGVTNDENAYAFNQTRFTPKGIKWIAGLWAAHCVATSLTESV